MHLSNKHYIIYSKFTLLISLLCFVFLTGCSPVNQEKEKVSETSSEKITSQVSQTFQSSSPLSTSTDNTSKNPKSTDEIIALVNEDDPYELKPSMSEKERYDLRNNIYNQMSESNVKFFIQSVESSAIQLQNVLSDNRYEELIDTKNSRWDSYDSNNLYGISELLTSSAKTIENKSLKNDLNTVSNLCREGLLERNILKIIDANRILQDLSRHLIQVPYQEKTDAIVDYGNIHDLYYKVTETLEGKQKLLSD